MKTLLTIILSLACLNIFASSYPFDWEANRKQYVLNDEERAASELILRDHVEYAYVLENDQFLMYCVIHRIVRVNNAEAIQRHNRIQISMDRTFELTEVKARAITASGKIINFDKSNLRELNQEESGHGYRIFAMEGVEMGSEVEYFYVKKMSPNIFGKIYFQKDVRVRDVSFLLKAPKNLEFEFKPYHGLPAVESKLVDEQNVYSLTASNLDPINEEAFANSDKWNKRLEFRLAYNKGRSHAKMYTWDQAGKEFYARLFTLTKDEEKALEKFVKTLKDDPSKALQSRIRNIERQIKTTVQIDDQGVDESLKDIVSIVKYKVSSEVGMTKLFVNTFSALKVPVQIVLGCDRRYREFDENFDSWNFLDDYFLYFPDANTFLSPYNAALYSPIIDPEFTGHKGLFIEPIQIGSLKSALASVKDIPAAPWHYNTDNLDIMVKFNPDLNGNEISLKRYFKGNSAAYIAPYYHLMTEEQKQNMIDELMKSTAPGIEIKKWSGKTNFENEVDEFIMDVDFTTSHFLERAGSRILFKIGLIIGPQSELYQNDKRNHPVENHSNRGYERTITVVFPEGYAVKNPDDLKFNVLYTEGDATPFSFVSSYKLQGQTLTLTINEYYKELYAPLNRYEDFRKVVNAAADFNKITLVLEKAK